MVSDDDRKGPPRRFGTNADRDVFVPKHDSAPVYTVDEGTGQHQGVELEAIRSNRPTDIRFKHVEKHIDMLRDGFVKLDTKVDGIAESHALVAGKIEVFIATVTKDRDELRDDKRERIKWTRGLITTVLAAAASGGAVIHWLLGHL